MAQGSLINCKKCGTLFVKGTREICDTCYKGEVDLADRIKNYIQSTEKAKVSADEILLATKIGRGEFEKLFEKGRLFSVMNKITIKCRFCGIEFECEHKAGFVCPKCIMKFSNKSGFGNVAKPENAIEESKKRTKIADKHTLPAGQERYGFIQNYQL